MIDRSKNYTDIVEALTATRDIHGNELKVGNYVRSHDFAMLLDDGRIIGMEVDSEIARVSYYEAEIVAIGEEFREGCRRYTLRTYLYIGFANGKNRCEGFKEEVILYPPENGTRSSLGGRTFGVELIASPVSKDYREAVLDITETKDVFGEHIAVGDIVRWHDYPVLNPNTGAITGLTTEYDGTCPISYYEAEVLAIGDVYLDGAERYTLKALLHREHYGLGSRQDCDGELLYPVVNGTKAAGHTSFAVVKIGSSWPNPYTRGPNILERTRAAVTLCNTSNDEGVNVAAFMGIFHPKVSQTRVNGLVADARKNQRERW